MFRHNSNSVVTARIGFLLLALCLSANLAFAATTKALRSGKTGRGRSKTASGNFKKIKPNSTSSQQPSTEAVADSQLKLAAPANLFRNVGDPFLVLTASTQQQQTPAQRDATRPPGTEQRQPVPRLRARALPTQRRLRARSDSLHARPPARPPRPRRRNDAPRRPLRPRRRSRLRPQPRPSRPIRRKPIRRPHRRSSNRIFQTFSRARFRRFHRSRASASSAATRSR